jgi:hypothetical protein
MDFVKEVAGKGLEIKVFLTTKGTLESRGGAHGREATTGFASGSGPPSLNGCLGFTKVIAFFFNSGIFKLGMPLRRFAGA